jgi:hypothetical protein
MAKTLDKALMAKTLDLVARAINELARLVGSAGSMPNAMDICPREPP